MGSLCIEHQVIYKLESEWIDISSSYSLVGAS